MVKLTFSCGALLVRAIQEGLESISQGGFQVEDKEMTVRDMAQLFNIEKWIEIDSALTEVRRS